MRGTVLGVTVLGLLLAGCTSSDSPRFEVGDLAAGTCSQVGEPLLEVERTQSELAAGALDAPAAAADYEQLQADLLAARETADQPVADALRTLVTSMGFFRVGAAAGTSSEIQQEQLRGSLDAVLVACGVEPDEG